MPSGERERIRGSMKRSIPVLLTAALIVGICPFASHAGDIESGLLLHLPLNKDLEDHSPLRQSIEVAGVIPIRDGAAFFSGKETALGITNVTLSNRPFTFAMWIRQTGKEQMYGLVEQKHAKRQHHWLHLMLRGARQPYLGFYNNDSMSPAGIKPGNWVHLIFSYDGEHQMIWIDGQAACARKESPYRGSKGTLWIGRTPRWNNVPSHDFEGYMKEIRLYDRVLSWSEIGQLSKRQYRQAAGVSLSAIPDPAGMPLSHARARDGGVPFIYVDGNRLCVIGESSQIYQLQSAADLFGPWESLGTVTNVLGKLEMTDPLALGHRQRFYRIEVVGAR